MKNLFAEEIAQRLNVSLGTLHKRAFQRRIKLPVGRIGKRIFCPEHIFDQWVLDQAEGSGEAKV